MRPLRFVLLLFCFIAIPLILTCISLLRGREESSETLQYRQRSRLRALLSFSTPSSLFPPSAIISLTADNSTFFIARPAAFGPSLPSRGLSGQLWVGKGFGDDALLSDEALKISGFELGCSDVPGWGEHQQKTPDNPALSEKTFKDNLEKAPTPQLDSPTTSDLHKRDDLSSEEIQSPNEDDGTDDHLHRPLPDSNPALPGKPGEPAQAVVQEKTRKPVHADIESLQESADIAGKVVLLSRGGCGFLEKVKWAQRRGGIAVIVGDNERNGQLTVMYAKGDTSNITIPAIFTSYTSAHLLSSLVPPEKHETSVVDSGKPPANGAKENDRAFGNGKGNKAIERPIFTTTTIAKLQPTEVSSQDGGGRNFREGSWMQKALQAVGFDESAIHAEDSRRPPGSGNIEWVQVKDWDEEDFRTTTTSSTVTKIVPTPSRAGKDRATSIRKFGNDDFVIGVQDWRDTDLIAPKSTSSIVNKAQKVKGDNTKIQQSSTHESQGPRETALKGGSIIPGSGEYAEANEQQRVKHEKDQSRFHSSTGRPHQSHRCFIERVKSFLGFSGCEFPQPKHVQHSNPVTSEQRQSNGNKDIQEGLWVTLTPTSVSTSPFFDTLLVLVVSPLVTLTFVYGLLLLRTRIRRRRWRAPKSLVERLPVRTYHTMSTASSTTSSQLSSPDRSATGSPLLRPESIRARQRSQTTTGVMSPTSSHSQSPPAEKPSSKPKPKRYRGRQLECVVCLEEYIDGESQVMSLPCGHEFHVDCITPWLINRRRTCPICKGDVVRSLQRNTHGGSSFENEDGTELGEETSDDIQERVVNTVADDASAAIPIPERHEIGNIMDDDIERGSEVISAVADETSTQQQQPIASRWRGILNASVATLSGDTVWRTNSVDRNR